jgi:hypothetical protein
MDFRISSLVRLIIFVHPLQNAGFVREIHKRVRSLLFGTSHRHDAAALIDGFRLSVTMGVELNPPLSRTVPTVLLDQYAILRIDLVFINVGFA